jgi:arsenate reductase (thioredoxin)
MKYLLVVLALMLARPGIGQGQGKDGTSDIRRNKKIVFVCEHGAALSVVSAAYFNKIAHEQHLNFYAIARGTTLQKDLAVSAREGLQADGVAFETERPQALSDKDVAHARRIVTFVAIPAKYSKMVPVEIWDDVPPTGANYGQARDAILRHLTVLIRQLQVE